ncbi:50S ribosomal protein L30 [uncultured archaeon]|nr:50S ribosomal protein L30 [uncultured archaeon]
MTAIALIRMKGLFSMPPKMRGALESFKLSRLYACTLVNTDDSTKGMIQCCKDVVSYGEVDKETVTLLLTKRGKKLDGKRLTPEEAKKAADEFMAGKKLSATGVSSVFYLSPPKGGIGERKLHVPFGPLGKNPEIMDLISRMA